jgi:hypothetical protein
VDIAWEYIFSLFCYSLDLREKGEDLYLWLRLVGE